MKTFRDLIMLLALCVAPMFAVANELDDSPRGAQISFVNKVIDLGTLSRDGDKQVVNLMFTNMGDEPLLMHTVRTGCDCIKAKVEDHLVDPGQSGSIIITVDPSKAPEGSFYRVLQVDSTAKGGVQHITLTAEIE